MVRRRTWLVAWAFVAGVTPGCGTVVDLCEGDNPLPDCTCANPDVPDRDLGHRSSICPECMTDPPHPDCENAPHRDGGAEGGLPPGLFHGDASMDAALDSSVADASADSGLDAGPCPQGCSGARPLCLGATDTCVACRTDADCDGSTPRCDSATYECVECLVPADCSGATPRCDSAAHECVECLAHADCDDPAAAKCAIGTHTCVACTGNAQCTHLSGKGVCDAADGACVECTGKDYVACGTDVPSGDPYVCDSLARTCSATKTERSTGLCGTCVSDAQCNLGQLCVLEEFTSQDIGYFCAWRKNAGVGGAPAACSTARPFVGTLADQTSIDGVTADVCALRVTTCVGYNHYSNPTVNCEPAPNTPDDFMCGASGVDDAYCRYLDDDGAGNNNYRCTLPCLSDDDCKVGSTCNTGVVPNVCTL